MAYRTEHTFATPVEVEPGVLRLTLPLPTGTRHVHCYFLRGDDDIRRGEILDLGHAQAVIPGGDLDRGIQPSQAHV